MTIKKTFITTSSFLVTAVLLSQISTFKNIISPEQNINYSAFINLAKNVECITSNSSVKNIADDTTVTNEIISVIDKELTGKIKHSRFALHKKVIIKKEEVIVAAPVVEKQKTEEQISDDAEIATLADDLSGYEINNNGLISLYALDTDKVSYISFESIKLASSYGEIVSDEVALAQASPTTEKVSIADEVKTIQPSTERAVEEVAPEIKEKEEEEKADQEMEMFDYSEKNGQTEKALTTQTIDQKLYERPLSKTVQKAIDREIGSAQIKKLETPKTAMMDNQKIDLDSSDNIVYDYTQDKVKTTQAAAKEVQKEIEAFTAPVKIAETQFILRAKEINLSTQKQIQAHAFEYVPDYDRAERTDDQTSGEIHFGYSLSGEMNTQTGVVQSQGMITTRVELNLGTETGIEVPLLNEEGVQKFLQKRNVSIEGNLLMLAIDPSILDTEIDSSFGARFFFDKKFKSINTSANASYVLYAGVKTGNIMVRYLLSNKESAQKIVYVGDGEMFFEDASFTNSNRETFSFTSRNLLGQKQKELIISGEAISYFNTNITARKKTLNAYEIKVPELASGMRKYLEFKHLNDSIFVGSWNQKDIEIPGNDFIGKVLEANQVNSLKDRCVVQINLSKDLREIKANGKNRTGEMFVESTSLDNEGNFSRDSFELAEKVFVTGDMEGQFNIKLDYTDGSTEFLKTFCSEGTYLVEQL